jgi:hypothetical protein
MAEEQVMEIDVFKDRFFEMEMEADLFFCCSLRQRSLWDIARFDLFLSLFDHLIQPQAVPLSSHAAAPSSLSQKLLKFADKIRGSIVNFVRLATLGRGDFLLFSHRRFLDEAGTPVDFSSADTERFLRSQGSVTRVESKLIRDQTLNFTSLFSIASRIWRLSSYERKQLEAFASRVENAQLGFFGTSDPAIRRLLFAEYHKFKVESRLWYAILKRARPRLAFMTQNGIQKGLLHAARALSIPVVECQHGVINLMHPAYSYPAQLLTGDHLLLPDVILLFSKYWERQCCLPGTEKVVVGNSHFHYAGPPSSREGPAIFIDADPLHGYLGPLARDVASALPERRFVLKIHPAQFPHQPEIAEDFAGLANVEVVGPEKNMAELLCTASDAIIIQSTASYEALDRTVPVHVFARDGYRSHKDLFANPNVHVFGGAEELQTALFKPLQPTESNEKFFQVFTPAGLSRYLSNSR